MAPLPALFVGHGSPMNAIETNRWTNGWAEMAASLPTPRAILVLSAHWYVATSAVTAMAVPPVLHDFSGFPPSLSLVHYPAPGAPSLARQVAELARPTVVHLDEHTWGIDHGTWSVLARMYPEANVPVVQLSIDASRSWGHHLELGAALATLADEDVLLVGSGNVVHNLGAIDWAGEDQGYDWAQRFDGEVQAIMQRDPSQLGTVAGSDDFRLAVPTPEHFLPLAYIAGFASARGAAVSVFNEGCTMGSLSMTSYVARPS
jgi:4,5-DOPA dioxygenase extradiol